MRHLQKRLVRAAATVVVGLGVALTALGVTATAPRAAMLSLNSSGVFGAGSLLNSADISGLAFTYEALFESTADLAPSFNEFGLFKSNVKFSIAGLGNVFSAPSADINASFGFNGNTNVALADSSFTGSVSRFNSIFSGTSSPFDFDSPTPTIFTGFLGFNNNNPLLIPTIGSGDLLIEFGAGFSLNPNASITAVAAVPLPAALPLFGTGLGILGFLGWRRRRKAQAV